MGEKGNYVNPSQYSNHSTFTLNQIAKDEQAIITIINHES